MLKFIKYKSNTIFTIKSCNFIAPAIAPSTKTTVILNKLPNNITETILKESLNDISLRKIELQPGCILHVANIAAAEKISNIIKSTYKNTNIHIASTTIPSILIENLSEDITVDSITTAFSKHKPTSVNITGGSTIQVTSSNYEQALKISEHIETISLNNNLLKSNITKLSDNLYIVQVYNFNSVIITKEQEKTINESIKTITNDFKLSVYNSPKSMQLRLNTNISDIKEHVKLLKKINIKDVKLEISEPYKLKLPTIFIRNTEKIDMSTVVSIINNTGATRIQTTYRSKDKYDDLVVAYYDSNEKAFDALTKLKGSTISGVKIAASYKEVAEPEVIFYDLPIDWDESYIRNRLQNISILKFSIDRDIKSDRSTRDIRILFGNLRQANLAKVVLSGLCSRVEDDGLSHTGLDINIPAGSNVNISDVIEAISKAKIPNIKSINVNNNKTAFVNFLTLNQADNAQKSYISGNITIPSASKSTLSDKSDISIGSMLSMRKSVHPTYVIELSNLSVDTPVVDIETLIDNNHLSRYYLYSDRFAIVKFKRHQYVVHGIKKLKDITINGQSLHVERYYPVTSNGTSSLDVTDPLDEEFDKFTLKALMADNMYTDPATRYQIAKNAFDRALYDAQRMKSVSEACHHLLSDSISPKIKEEASNLLLSKVIDENVKQRLFELFLQRDDLQTHVKDFNDLSVLYGDANNDSNDPLHWTNFDVFSEEDIVRLEKAIIDREEDLNNASFKFSRKMLTSDQSNDYINEIDNEFEDDNLGSTEDSIDNFESDVKKKAYVNTDQDDDDDDFESKDDNDDKDDRDDKDDKDDNEDKDETDELELVDDDGRVWSGIILDNDTTQKILPGNRLTSYRVLVVIGNARGSGGYGMGKGTEPSKAVDAAFRDALRNLIHIDLYENAGLAHDLFGKHNGCYCYVRATSTERLMVASPFAEEVLNLFGISSASVKFAGKRNPYSMIKSLVNALKEHKNLDETAKERGKRFLTLKWAHQHNL